MKYVFSFRYFKKQLNDWTRDELLRRLYDLCNEVGEKNKEIERLNNIIDKIRMCLFNYTSEYYTNEDEPRTVRLINAEMLENTLEMSEGDDNGND